jgi:purine-binding chemotaxis protein CheW
MQTSPSRPADADIWSRLQQRLLAAARATEELTRPSPERARAILEERARRLARSAPHVAPDIDRLLVVTFGLGSDRYALGSTFVREVRQPRSLTPLPGVPDYCAGIVNLRGKVLPAFYLHRLLGLPAEDNRSYQRVLYLGADTAELGLLADAVFEVAPLDAGALLSPAGRVPTAAQSLVEGVLPNGLVVLSAPALLQDPRLILDQKEEPL